MPKVIFMGTNGWFDTKAGNTISTLVKAEKYNIVLDAGNGISKLSRYIDGSKPTYLFISHFHLDHVEGLHTLCINRFPAGLTFIVEEGGTQILNRLMQPPYMGSLDSMNFNSRIIETQNGRCDLPFKASFLQMNHVPFCQGIRMEVDGVVLAHCLDTGYCENAVKLARNADLLIIECTLKPGSQERTHLNPLTCARIGLESGTKRMALTHFEGRSYPDMESRKEAEQTVKERFENAFLCLDDMAVDLTKE